MNTVTSLSSNVSEALTELQDLNRDVEQHEAEVSLAESLNEQSALDRSRTVTAVAQLQETLDNLDTVNLADLEEIRMLVSSLRAEYNAADLSGVHEGLVEMLEEQRAERQRLEMQLHGLTDDIEHLRRVNLALPDPSVCRGRN